MLEIQALSWESNKCVAELSQLMGSQPSPLDNWISNGNIQMIIKNLHRFTSAQKWSHTITKMITYYHKNDHILSQKWSHTITKMTTYYHKNDHILSQKRPHTITKKTTYYHKKDRILSQKWPHTITKMTTYYHKNYHILSQKRPHTITKMYDNMNMDSTIAGLMNARS